MPPKEVIAKQRTQSIFSLPSTPIWQITSPQNPRPPAQATSLASWRGPPERDSQRDMRVLGAAAVGVAVQSARRSGVHGLLGGGWGRRRAGSGHRHAAASRRRMAPNAAPRRPAAPPR